MLNRTIRGYDIATGTALLTSEYFTKGPVDSTYVNGNATVTNQVLPMNATYNTTTNQPNPPYDVVSEDGSSGSMSSSSSGEKLLTRLDRAKLDAKKARAREAEMGVPWSTSRRVVQKKGRHMLFEENGRRKTQDHGHDWKQEI